MNERVKLLSTDSREKIENFFNDALGDEMIISDIPRKELNEIAILYGFFCEQLSMSGDFRVRWISDIRFGIYAKRFDPEKIIKNGKKIYDLW